MADAGQVAVTKMEPGTTSGGVMQQANKLLSGARTRWGAIPDQRRPWMIAGVAMIAALVAGMFWYAERPDWRVLFSGLESKDTQQVSQELAAAGISYQMTPDGSGIEVPAEMLDKARMEVATKGMPQSGRLGFELFDKPNWVGSEFDEHVNYQRALEGELEHTISTLGVVRSARVHLAMPQVSLFAEDQKPAKASVIMHLKHPALPQEQADSIRNLVAGAIENLSPDQVTLVDADGRVNLQPRSRSAAEGDAEQALESKLVAMLEPLAGQGNVRASVNVSYDEAGEERTDEVYDPSQAATLSTQKSERTSGSPKGASGVPGTASNSPSASAPGAVAGSSAAAAPGTPPLLQKAPLPVYPQAGNPIQSENQESNTYAVTKHVVHTEASPGRLRRVTAAVVVNDRETLDPGAKTRVWRPRSVEEMRRLEELAQAAVGFDVKRGDQVVLENISFNSNVAEVKASFFDRMLEGASGLLHAQPSLYRTGVVGLLGLALIFFILRPLTSQVVKGLREPLLLASTQTFDATATDNQESSVQAPPDWLNEPQPEAVPYPVSRRTTGIPKTRDSVYGAVVEHIRREPAQSTRLLEAWIGDAGKES
ncbi:flagellar M-ring protein FliF [Granulicella sp. WH15]|uniref:flagellar basal-body MS-ring/collar protein FliF n=1 Tax=Granulicella sp. WH15 TaxID=2602070 RepID=UPI001366BCE9|nr:flagellar basal-body MS-ring/collar protein FliF [Granulicella sp. WH15]QHN03921.1 flagellar M-ring protein FliF [Granulicella sp. WH15]